MAACKAGHLYVSAISQHLRGDPEHTSYTHGIGEIMQTKHYQVIFEGHILKGYDLNRVKTNLVSLLRIDRKKIDRLFANKPSVIKRKVNYQIISLKENLKI